MNRLEVMMLVTRLNTVKKSYIEASNVAPDAMRYIKLKTRSNMRQVCICDCVWYGDKFASLRDRREVGLAMHITMVQVSRMVGQQEISLAQVHHAIEESIKCIVITSRRGSRILPKQLNFI
jgi:hypothetical protein